MLLLKKGNEMNRSRQRDYKRWFKKVDKELKSVLGMTVDEYYLYIGHDLPIQWWKGSYYRQYTPEEAIKSAIGDVWNKEWQTYLAAKLHGV